MERDQSTIESFALQLLRGTMTVSSFHNIYGHDRQFCTSVDLAYEQLKIREGVTITNGQKDVDPTARFKKQQAVRDYYIEVQKGKLAQVKRIAQLNELFDNILDTENQVRAARARGED